MLPAITLPSTTCFLQAKVESTPNMADLCESGKKEGRRSERRAQNRIEKKDTCADRLMFSDHFHVKPYQIRTGQRWTLMRMFVSLRRLELMDST